MKLFTLLFFFLVTAQAQIKPVDQQYIQGENYLLNAGFENGRTGWTESGTATDTLEQSIVRFGLQSLKIISSSQTVDLSQVVTKNAAQSGGQQGLASAWIKSTSAISEVCAVADSVDVKCVTIEASNTWKEYVIPFVMGSTNNGIRIKSASDSATTYIDNVFVGVMPATMMPNVENISQWVDYGATTITATTTNPTKGTTVIDKMYCREVGQDYECQFIYRQSATGTGGSGDYIFALPNGIEIDTTVHPAYSTVGTGIAQAASMIGEAFLWTNSGPANGYGKAVVYSATQFRLQGNIFFANGGTMVSGTVYPTSQVISYRATLKFRGKNIGAYTKIYSGDTIYPHAQIAVQANTFATSCSWTSTNAAWGDFPADADCADWTIEQEAICDFQVSNSDLPQITANNCPAGNYLVEYNFHANYSGSGALYYRISDGISAGGENTISVDNVVAISPTISNIFNYTSSGNRTWKIQGYRTASTNNQIEAQTDPKRLKVKVTYFPPKDNPIIGTFEGIEKCEDDFECTDTFSAKVSSAGVVSDENLDWINGNATISSSQYVFTFNSGTFALTPNCWATMRDDLTSTNSTNIRVNSSSGVTVNIMTSGGALATDRAFILTCQKQGSDYKPKTAKAATTTEMMYVPNVTRPKTCYYAFGGAGATLASPTVCSTGTCVEVTDKCSAISPPTFGSTGVYNNLTIANGTFKASTELNCTCNAYDTIAGAQYRDCRFTSDTGDQTWSTNANGGAVLNLTTSLINGSLGNTYVILTCTADAP